MQKKVYRRRLKIPSGEQGRGRREYQKQLYSYEANRMCLYVTFNPNVSNFTRERSINLLLRAFVKLEYILLLSVINYVSNIFILYRNIVCAVYAVLVDHAQKHVTLVKRLNVAA